MIAEKNKYMSEAAMAMYELNADEIIRQQCMARKDAEEAKEWAEQERRNVVEVTRQLEQERSNYEAEITRLQELIAQKQQ